MIKNTNAAQVGILKYLSTVDFIYFFLISFYFNTLAKQYLDYRYVIYKNFILNNSKV